VEGTLKLAGGGRDSTWLAARARLDFRGRGWSTSHVRRSSVAGASSVRGCELRAPILTWTAHPARRRPKDVALVIAVVCITTAVVLSTFQSALLGALATIVLVASVGPFLFPTRYALTDEGIEATRFFTRRTRRYRDLRRLEIGARAALVSPLPRASFLDRYRGLTLFLDGADRQKVIELLRERVPTHARIAHEHQGRS
jgi:hypothetical protein